MGDDRIAEQEKRVKKEIRRLNRIFQGLPENKMDLVQGLIVQAARLRVLLDDLWQDIQENGGTELFSQSDKTEPYMRERPASKLFTQNDKNYQALMKQLTDLCPEIQGQSKLEALFKAAKK